MWRIYKARVVMIWSHLPRGVKENGAVCGPIEMPSGAWYVDEVVRGLVW